MWPVLLERAECRARGRRRFVIMRLVPLGRHQSHDHDCSARELAAGERRAWHFRGSNGRLPMIMDDLGPAPAKRVEANIPV